MTRNRTVMLAAGGTGGHLFPAFALAEELGRRGFTVDLMTDMRGDRYGTGFPARAVHQVPSATLASKSPVAVARTGMTLARGILAARKIMKEVKPAVVVGFGGYPSFPPLLAARHLAIPTMLHEQNAVLGRANKMLARRVDAIATSFETTKFLDGPLLAKSRFTGNPVRGIVVQAASAPYPLLAPDGPFNLLVFGGSQGARYFSDAIPPALSLLPASLKARLTVVQQAREEDVIRVREAYAASGISAEIATFFKDLPARMAASHLVIGRAGASSVAELTVIGRPSILVPLPHSLDNDQLQNATRLAESGGGWCIEQRTLSPERLSAEIARLMEGGAELREAADCAKKLGRPDAVARLATLVEELAGPAKNDMAAPSRVS
ncbi:MAG: undecaprenyldiphospho-muramoylpentapeptide beta-N-acetylglucosaminyltransferase [Hyphomicrobium sp.]|jgi:UDP-N-acetylglucosamine--N-acetylmuramyl-(pentapeptide) pyrophosphoryl-undecaprenol N-acetylglucosamine transferase|nr:undecaprenyldiphospho-muramoylpentapeptide beta-N-acetylglucosaminyltransferase [Hyphomicrobium sp.]